MLEVKTLTNMLYPRRKYYYSFTTFRQGLRYMDWARTLV